MPATPLRLYRGHLVALVVFASSGLTIGSVQYAFGEFVGPLRAEFGWTQTQINLALSFALIANLGAPLIGRAADRWGIRPILVLSLLALAVGFLLRPLISELWHLYLFSSLVYLGFPGATLFAVGKLVKLWYPATAGRVTGAVTSGNNFGGLTLPALAAVVIAAAGWRAAYVAYGLLSVALAVVALLVVTEERTKVARAMDASGRAHLSGHSAAASAEGLTLREALRSRRFLLTMVGLVAASFTYQGVLTQLRQHFQELGMPPAQATIGLAVIAAMGVGSKLLFGRASEWITARWSTVISVSLQAVGVTVLALASGPTAGWVGIVIFGTGFGGLGALLVLAVQEVVGMKQFGTVMGVVQSAAVVSLAGGPLLAGIVHDATGGYGPAFLVFAGVFVVGVLLMVAARPEQRPS